MTKYICILVIGWPRPKQLAKNLLILKTFNCFAALRRLREFDAKQPFNEEETRGIFYCFFSNWHPIQKKGFPKTAYHLNDCIFQLYTAWRSTILDDYTTKTKDQVSRMSRGFLSYFTKTRENALNRPVYRAQGTVLQIIWTILIFFGNQQFSSMHSVRQKYWGRGWGGVNFVETAPPGVRAVWVLDKSSQLMSIYDNNRHSWRQELSIVSYFCQSTFVFSWVRMFWVFFTTTLIIFRLSAESVQ